MAAVLMFWRMLQDLGNRAGFWGEAYAFLGFPTDVQLRLVEEAASRCALEGGEAPKTMPRLDHDRELHYTSANGTMMISAREHWLLLVINMKYAEPFLSMWNGEVTFVRGNKALPVDVWMKELDAELRRIVVLPDQDLYRIGSIRRVADRLAKIGHTGAQVPKDLNDEISAVMADLKAKREAQNN